jgi:putative transcriptional regulator
MKLDTYLEQAGLTHGQFAEMIGCEQPTITRFTKGRVPSPDLMRKIVEATDGAVTPNDFFDLDAPASSDVEAA